jgi:hypothetical protein
MHNELPKESPRNEEGAPEGGIVEFSLLDSEADENVITIVGI